MAQLVLRKQLNRPLLLLWIFSGNRPGLLGLMLVLGEVSNETSYTYIYWDQENKELG